MNSSRLASLPSVYAAERPFATEYSLAYITLPKDQEFLELALKFLREDISANKILLNVEYRLQGSPPAARLFTDEPEKQDILKNLVAEGLLIVDTKRERFASKIVSSLEFTIYIHIGCFCWRDRISDQNSSDINHHVSKLRSCFNFNLNINCNHQWKAYHRFRNTNSKTTEVAM